MDRALTNASRQMAYPLDPTNGAAYENSDDSAAAYSPFSSSAAAKPSPAKGKPTSAKLQRVTWSPEVCVVFSPCDFSFGSRANLLSTPFFFLFISLLSFSCISIYGKGGRVPEEDHGQHQAEQPDSLERPGEANTRQDGCAPSLEVRGGQS